MRAVELPQPDARLELEWLLGAWYVLFSNRSQLRARPHPRVELEQVEPNRVQLALFFRSHDLLGRERNGVSLATAAPEGPTGCFLVHGHGFARANQHRLCFPIVEPQQRWAIAWHGRSRFGGGSGLDIYTRDPSITQAQLDAILAAVRAHPFLAERHAGLFATEQHWIPPEPYRLT